MKEAAHYIYRNMHPFFPSFVFYIYFFYIPLFVYLFLFLLLFYFLFIYFFYLDCLAGVFSLDSLCLCRQYTYIYWSWMHWRDASLNAQQKQHTLDYFNRKITQTIAGSLNNKCKVHLHLHIYSHMYICRFYDFFLFFVGIFLLYSQYLADHVQKEIKKKEQEPKNIYNNHLLFNFISTIFSFVFSTRWKF